MCAIVFCSPRPPLRRSCSSWVGVTPRPPTWHVRCRFSSPFSVSSSSSRSGHSPSRARDRLCRWRTSCSPSWHSAFLALILLNARFVHYGFVFAVPAAMLAVVSLVDWIPARIATRSGNGATFRWACIPLLVGLIGVFLQLSGTCLARKNTPVGEGGNAFIADARGEQVNAVLGFLAREIPAGQSLAVVPEGAMINVLSGRTNPGYCLNLMPPEIATLGESRVLSDLEKSPPDVIVVDLDRIGPDGLWFRRETYAPNIANWMLGHYQLVARFESPPNQMMMRLGVLRHQPAPSPS